MKAICVIISIAALAVLAPVASAVIINVPGDYPTIQEGIDAAQNGDTVVVAPGGYVEELSIQSTNILLSSDQGPQNTQITGNLSISGQVDTSCIIRGFAFRRQIADGPLLHLQECGPIVEANEFVGGYNPEGFGGAIRLHSANAIIRNNIIRGNSSFVVGGGIGSGWSGEPIIEGNIIADNLASSGSFGGAGGGISIESGTIRRNLIVGNQAYHGASGQPAIGGGISGGSPLLIENNTLCDNSAWSPGGGMGGGLSFWVSQAEAGVIRNNIIVFSSFGGGVSGATDDTTWTGWDYNLVFGNEPYDYDGFEPGPHDVQADPLFVDRFSGDYSLLPNSPCIDAGDPDSPLDPDGTRADIGAYYFDQAVGIENPGGPSGPYRFQLHQNYPNPFNSQTIISYYLTEESVVSLHIYSITGHFVTATTNKEMQTSGEHKYVWDGKDKKGKMVSTGIYFYELYVDDYRESKAMIMIK